MAWLEGWLDKPDLTAATYSSGTQMTPSLQFNDSDPRDLLYAVDIAESHDLFVVDVDTDFGYKLDSQTDGSIFPTAGVVYIGTSLELGAAFPISNKARWIADTSPVGTGISK